MRIAIASDHAGFELKKEISEYLRGAGHEVEDFGCYSDNSCDYPDYGYAASLAVSEKKCERAVLVCGSGVGMSIVANKVPHVRAVLCFNDEVARLSREHNDANVICIGARFTKPTDAIGWIDIFLETPFTGGRHEKRVQKIFDIEKKCGGKL